jgi:DNA-binding FadR family transcriptional regulator
MVGQNYRSFDIHCKFNVTGQEFKLAASCGGAIIGSRPVHYGGNPLPKIVASGLEGSLRERIAAGEWSATGRLPAERDLAAEYGVARNTVRRAVEAMASDGTVERHVGRGTFLNGGTSELANILQRITGVSPADLMTARLIVEPQAAAIAAKNASLPDLHAIAEAHHHATQAHQTDEFEHWDSQFHQRLFAATRNELLVSIHDILQVIRSRNAWIELKRKTFSENRRRDYCEQHGNVVAALQNRDADGAAQAMLRHIEAIEVALFRR